MNYAPFPFLRVGFFIVSGIILAEKEHHLCYFIFPLIITLIIILGLFLCFTEVSQFLHPYHKGILLMVLVFVFGAGITLLRQYKNTAQTISCFNGEKVTLTGILQEELKATTGTKYIMETSLIKDCDDNISAQQIRIIVSFQDSECFSSKFSPGDKITLSGKIYRFEKPGNPASFNYAQYMYYQSIVQQVRVGGEAYALHDHNNLPCFQSWAYQLGNYTSALFQKYLSEQNKPLADALLLGRRSDLENDLYELFSITGCIHVLSVSGMHVAIFAAPLLLVFSWFKKSSLKLQLIQVTILVGLIWFYVILTGSSPSVVRSGIMISLIYVGRIFKPKVSGIHILFLTLVVMLSINPYYLFQLSFQFSFLSLMGLQLFYSKLKDIIFSKWVGINYIWETTSASIAAQAIILPFSLFYFHLFPVYFILGGIIAVPLVSIIIYVGTLMVIMESLFQPLNLILSFAMNKIMEILVKSMNLLVELPYSAIKGIYISHLGLAIFVMAISAFLIWFYSKNTRALYVFLTLLFCGIAENKWDALMANKHNEIVIYDVRSQILMDVINGRSTFCISSMKSDDKRIKYAASGNRIDHRSKEEVHSYCDPKKSNIYFNCNGLKGMVASGFFTSESIVPNRNQLDVLYISGNMKGCHREMYHYYRPKFIVLHSSLSLREYGEWVAIQQEHCFNLHYARLEGAFILKS